VTGLEATTLPEYRSKRLQKYSRYVSEVFIVVDPEIDVLYHNAAIWREWEKHAMGTKREIPLEWLDLDELSNYAPFSRRTLGEWIRRPDDPLPAYQVKNKIVVRKAEFDEYIKRHRIRIEDLDRIVQELLEGVNGR
jgi:Helix-turn-helix domain